MVGSDSDVLRGCLFVAGEVDVDVDCAAYGLVF